MNMNALRCCREHLCFFTNIKGDTNYSDMDPDQAPVEVLKKHNYITK